MDAHIQCTIRQEENPETLDVAMRNVINKITYLHKVFEGVGDRGGGGGGGNRINSATVQSQIRRRTVCTVYHSFSCFDASVGSKIYSRLSLSRLRLSRKTAYLEVKNLVPVLTGKSNSR